VLRRFILIGTQGFLAGLFGSFRCGTDLSLNLIETPPAELCSKLVSGAEKASIPATVSTQPEGETAVLRRGA